MNILSENYQFTLNQDDTQFFCFRYKYFEVRNNVNVVSSVSV
jgi:hypothetical protein